VPPARLFDEMLKLLTSGHSVKCITQLRDEGLHHGLLPLLDVILEQPMGEKFVMLSLKNTDERVRRGKGVSPGFLFATLLWHEVLAHWEKLKAKGEPKIPALYRRWIPCSTCRAKSSPSRAASPATSRTSGPCSRVSNSAPASAPTPCSNSRASAPATTSGAARPGRRTRHGSGRLVDTLPECRWRQAAEMLLPEQAGDKKKRRRRKKPANAASSAAPASE
jgi:poly(A) polymerase